MKVRELLRDATLANYAEVEEKNARGYPELEVIRREEDEA